MRQLLTPEAVRRYVEDNPNKSIYFRFNRDEGDYELKDPHFNATGAITGIFVKNDKTYRDICYSLEYGMRSSFKVFAPGPDIGSAVFTTEGMKLIVTHLTPSAIYAVRPNTISLALAQYKFDATTGKDLYGTQIGDLDE